MNIDVVQAFSEAMQKAGFQVPEAIYPDGQIHRFCNDEKRRDRSGWYVLYTDGLLAGCFGDWRLGVKQNWQADGHRPLNDLDAADYQKKRMLIRPLVEKQRIAYGCEQAEHWWQQASPATSEHPYLQKKGVQAQGIRVYRDQLLIPIRRDETLYSLQWIDQAGTKRFLKGGTLKGCYFQIGVPGNVCCICEGYATGASLFEATGYAVVIAFHAGNLKAVAEHIHQQFPECRLVICADDDHQTTGNPGLTQAREAACLVGAYLAVPAFGSTRSDTQTDFNDLRQQAGLTAVKAVIEHALQGSQERILWSQSSHRQALVKTKCVAELKPESVQWIWPGWLASGKFHLLAGVAGTGKTTLALNIAAILSRGGFWPDGSVCEAGSVLIWSGEDNASDTLVPRLLAHQADPDRVHCIDRVIESKQHRLFDPARDLASLCQRVLEIGDVKLIIMDPVINLIAGDSHKNGEVRRGLQPLVELSDQLNIATLGISHFSKGTAGRDPLERVTGSVAFGALARLVWVAGKRISSEGGTQRVLVRAKSNYGLDKDGYAYSIEAVTLVNYPDVRTSRVMWGDALEGSASDLLMEPLDLGFPEERSALTEATEFLKVLLGDGPVSKKDINTKARELGIKAMTLRRAKQFLGAESTHEGYGSGSVWKWSLPAKGFKPFKDVKDVPVDRVNTCGDDEQA